MLRHQEHVDLSSYNTFHVKARARHMLQFDEEKEAVQWFVVNDIFPNYFILGQGSNVLFTGYYPGTIIRYTGEGIAILNESAGDVVIRVKGGMSWDLLVDECVRRGWGGIENLSFIPGTVGASPVQNIGAYGAEVQQVIEEVFGIDLQAIEYRSLTNQECRFGYRESIFKTDYRNRFLITSIVMRLSKKPILNTSYGALKDEVEALGGPTLKNVRQAVITIRRKKLPDPAIIGNAGSFFKNPVLETKRAEKIRGSHPDITVYPSGQGQVKLAAGWLIEKAGWKGKRVGDAGVHTEQALVLVNYGQATGKDILNLSEKIQESVYQKFGVHLEREVTVV
jgi:UDP-N-acetylmuramate dehydrogenase